MKRITILLLSVIFLAGCEEPTPPDEVVNNYWALVQEDNLEEARELVAEGREDAVGELDFEFDEEMYEFEGLEKIFKERFSLHADGYEKENDTAIVDVTVTKPDLKQTLGKFFEEAFQEIMAMAFEGASEEEMVQKAEELLLDAVEEAEDITHEEEAELHLEEGEWKIYDWLFHNIEERMEQIEEDLEGMDNMGPENNQ